MKKQKQKNLEKKGWKIGSAEEFLGLSEEESSYIELKIIRSLLTLGTSNKDIPRTISS